MPGVTTTPGSAVQPQRVRGQAATREERGGRAQPQRRERQLRSRSLTQSEVKGPKGGALLKVVGGCWRFLVAEAQSCFTEGLLCF